MPVSGSLRLTKASVSEYDPRAAEWAKTEVATRFLVKIWVYNEVAKNFSELTTFFRYMSVTPSWAHRPKYGRWSFDPPDYS